MRRVYRVAVSKKDERGCEGRVNERPSPQTTEDVAITEPIPNAVDKLVHIGVDSCLMKVLQVCGCVSKHACWLLDSVMLAASLAGEQPRRNEAHFCRKEIEGAVLVEVVSMVLTFRG
jgi:hypothetical protein